MVGSSNRVVLRSTVIQMGRCRRLRGADRLGVVTEIIASLSIDFGDQSGGASASGREHMDGVIARAWRRHREPQHHP